MQPTPAVSEIEYHLELANEERLRAIATRDRHRNRRRPSRQDEVAAAIDALRAAAKPLARYAKMALWHEFDPALDRRIKSATAELAVQRRALRKMLN